MKKLVALLLSCSFSSQAMSSLLVTDNNQKIQLMAVNDKMTSLSNAVMSCVGKGLQKEQCLCQHKNLLSDLQNTFEKTLRTYPQWKKLSLTTATSVGQTLYIDMDTLESQLKVSCP